LVHQQNAGRVDARCARNEHADAAQEGHEVAQLRRQHDEEPGDENTGHHAAQHRRQRATISQAVDGSEHARERTGGQASECVATGRVHMGSWEVVTGIDG
jgi:hypothetical protein